MLRNAPYPFLCIDDAPQGASSMSDETTQSTKSRLLAATRPIDPVVAARTRGRFTPEPVAQRPRKQEWRKQYARGPPDDDDRDAYSIKEFCRRHGISESFFFKLQAQGAAPDTITVGKRRLITREAARAWRKRRAEAAA
jgi:hypothetical protein